MATPDRPRPTAPDQLDRLRSRYERLRERRIEAGRDLEHATKRLEDLQREARDAYGTDDVAELRERLAALRAENARRVADYEGHLAEVEAAVRAAETDHREASAGDDR